MFVVTCRTISRHQISRCHPGGHGNTLGSLIVPGKTLNGCSVAICMGISTSLPEICLFCCGSYSKLTTTIHYDPLRGFNRYIIKIYVLYIRIYTNLYTGFVRVRG